MDVLAGLLPEFPEDVRRRIIDKWGLTRAQSAALVAEDRMVPFFEGVMESMLGRSPDYFGCLSVFPSEFNFALLYFMGPLKLFS